jgi:hypothetical protein
VAARWNSVAFHRRVKDNNQYDSHAWPPVLIISIVHLWFACVLLCFCLKLPSLGGVWCVRVSKHRRGERRGEVLGFRFGLYRLCLRVVELFLHVLVRSQRVWRLMFSFVSF